MAGPQSPFHTSHEDDIRDLARKFAQNELLPHVEKDEETETFRPELIQRLGTLGLTGLPISEEWGGAGLGYQEYCVALEEIAAVNAGYAISVSVSGLTQIILQNFGTEAQKKKYLPGLTAGKVIGAFSLSEAASGSDAGGLRTTAKRSGKNYILNGTKLWTTQGDSAGTMILMARTGGTGPKGVTAFIVEKGMSGLKCGKKEKKMGLNTSHTMELVLQNVEVPEENRVGEEGQGLEVALGALYTGRITIGACALGIARAALEVATGHAREREQFGKKIGEFQGISFMLADMKTLWDASMLLVRRAAWLRDQKQNYIQEASMAKLFATDMAMKVTVDAVQILGGSGYTKDFPVERYMREAKVMQIFEGTNQIQRMIIGRGLLKG